MAFDGRLRFLKELAKGGEIYTRLMGITPQDLAALTKVGDDALKASDFSTAARVFLSLEVFTPGKPDVTFRLAKAQVASGQAEEGLKTLTRYLELEAMCPAKSLMEALRLRAQLFESKDRSAADRDRQSADVIERLSQEQGT